MSGHASEHSAVSTAPPESREAHRHADTVPPTVQHAFLTTFGAVLAAYFFVVFCVARGLLRGVGFGLSESVQCFCMTLMMAGFIVWLAPLSQLMELWYHHRVPARRARRGLCPNCGHSVAGSVAEGKRCPECGGDRTLRPPLQFGWETIRRFSLVCGLAYLVGCLAGLAWLGLDERAFEREYLARPTEPHSRPRAWPASFSILHYDGTAASSASVAEPDVQPLDRPPPFSPNEKGPRSGERGP